MIQSPGLPRIHGRSRTRRVPNTLTTKRFSNPRRGTNTLSFRSQPDMILVGVRSVLSPRPCSAPQSTLPNKNTSAPSDHAYGSLQSSEKSFNEMDDFSDQSDVTNVSASQSNTSYGSFSQSRDSDNNVNEQSQDENENSVDTAIDISDNLFSTHVSVEEEECSPPHRLVTQSSKDSAFGSSTDGMNKDVADDNSVQALPLDTPREPLEEPEDLGNDSDTGSETSERISPDLHRNSDEGDREKQESTIIPSKLGADDALSASKKEEATSRMAATPPRGSPVLQETGGTLTTTTSESPGQKHNPTIIPPTIVTSDLTKGDPVTGSCRSVVNLQEVIDLRVVEAQRSGHLDLSNLGLPFFPSAVLLADGSMIHRVSLQDNQLFELTGSSLTQLTSVTWLDLRYNLLSDLPREVACLARLQVLLLQGNRLTSLPASLGTLPELATLQVSDNPIIFPPPDVIKGGTRVILRFLKEKCAASENNESLTNPCTADEDHPGGNHKILASNARERSESWEEEEEEDSSFDNEENGGGVERCGSARTWYGWDGGSEGDTEDSESDQNSRRRQKRGSENESKDDDDEEKGDNPPSLSTNFRIAITKGVEEQHDLHLSLQQRPDSESDTLGRASSPASACLLTPNFDFPTRPEFDVTREDATCERGLGHDPRGPEDNTPGVTWSCDCVQDTSCISPDSRMRILNRLPDSKHRFLNSFSSPRADSLQSFLLPVGSIMVPSEALSHIEGHRRTIHLHLQGDPHQLEDDMESLEGDLGEGYRRPLSEALSHTDDDCQRQVNSISLPVVRLQLPRLEEQLLLQQQQQQQLRGGTAAGSRRLWRTARRPLEGSRRSRPSLVSKRNQKEQHKPKLVTVAEVHRRAREERRRQRERLAAARELDANQRLKSSGGLEAWRQEARQLQLQQQYYHELHPDSYLPAVCEAPFAVDGTTLTPRARSRMKFKGDQKRSLSPSVSDVTGVCAGVRSCLEELSTAAEGGGGEGGEGDEEGTGGSLAHTSSIVHQLHHLRRQLHRLKVNCVI